MKVILVVLGLVSASFAANSCDNSFGAYLNALKDQLTASDSAAYDLEVEGRDDYYKLVRQCFSNGGDSSKCALSDDELKGDVYGDTGPMKGCSRCQGMARGLRDKFMKSDERVRKCFRRHFSQAIREELQPCIQGKISDGPSFRIEELPDFDEKTFKNIDIVEQGVNYRIMGRSRLDACRAVNNAKYQNTKPCMDDGFPGIYAKHCQCAKNAKSKVSGSCNSRFSEVKKATCQCMDEKREDWHTRFSKIQDIVNNAQTASECGDKISNVIGSWLSKIQSALNECLPKTSGQQTDLRTLINLGCGQVINGGVKKNELTVGFRFIRLFLDALNDRITMFCDKNCNF